MYRRVSKVESRRDPAGSSGPKRADLLGEQEAKVIVLPPMRVRARPSVFLVAGLAALLATAGCENKNASAAGGARPPMPVPMKTAQALPVSNASEYLAILKS